MSDKEMERFEVSGVFNASLERKNEFECDEI